MKPYLLALALLGCSSANQAPPEANKEPLPNGYLARYDWCLCKPQASLTDISLCIGLVDTAKPCSDEDYKACHQAIESQECLSHSVVFPTACNACIEKP